jgi:hypothetical protein
MRGHISFLTIYQMNKKINRFLSCCIVFMVISSFAYSKPFVRENSETIIIQSGFVQDKASGIWLEALKSRIPADKLDSVSRIRWEPTGLEKKWKKIIESKTSAWNSIRDSLSIPFKSLKLSDTIFVLVGFGGYDDGFTYGPQTVCLDLTALQREYGNADLPENVSRIDRLFAHEYTHLLHKAWAINSRHELRTFRDSILWECLYEGIGMYRSLNSRWLPVQGKLPEITIKTLKELYPVFVDRINVIQSGKPMNNEEKMALNKNLSRGAVNKKWGAFPVAIWLALEAKGDERNLGYWVNLGPEAVLKLSKKYID